MSPEQLLSTKNADYRSDVWALAVLAYHCLTGRVPFRGETLPSLSIEICGGRFRPPSELVDGLSTEYDDFFERAFQPDADGRFGSVRVLADTFRGLVRGAPQTGSADTQRRPTEPVGEDLAGPTMPSAAAGERHRSSSPRVMVHDAAEDPQGKDRRPPPDGTARAGVGRVNDSGVHEAVQAASADESGRRMAVGDTLAAGTSPTFSGAAATLEPETQQDRRRARYRLWAVLAAALVLVFAVDRALSSRLSDDPAPGATPRGDTDAAHPAAQATADIPTRGAEPEPPASAGVKAAKSAAPLSSAHAEASASAVPTERGAATSASVRAVAAPSPPAPVGPRPRRPAKPEPTTAPKADKSKPGCL
jgi:serine/threonine-protein kinase